MQNIYDNGEMCLGEVGKIRQQLIDNAEETWEIEDILAELKELEDNLKSYITQYKEKNDITRLTSLQKDMIKAEWQEKEYIQELMEIKERINDRRFD